MFILKWGSRRQYSRGWWNSCHEGRLSALLAFSSKNVYSLLFHVALLSAAVLFSVSFSGQTSLNRPSLPNYNILINNRQSSPLPEIVVDADNLEPGHRANGIVARSLEVGQSLRSQEFGEKAADL